jgi:hypothetical protein
MVWGAASIRQATASVAVAAALLGAASCASSPGEPRFRAASATRERAPRPSSSEGSYGLSTLPGSSSQSAGYYGAQYAWAVSNTGSGDVGGAGQGAWLELAITDLKFGLANDLSTPGGKQAYRAAIRELHQMASLPDTDVTPQQDAEYKTDVVGLNHFFHTKVPV